MVVESYSNSGILFSKGAEKLMDQPVTKMKSTLR